jgi:NSS family neurotransmitter:Na+ symporter
MPLGGLLIAIFVGYVMNKNDLIDLLEKDMGSVVFKIWYFSIRYIAPLAVIFLAYNAMFV